MAADRAGNTRKTAQRLGRLTGLTKIKDRLGMGDRTDMYDFRLRRSSRVTLNLSRARFDANLTLLNRRGRVIQRSQKRGRRPERIRETLAAGRYFVKVSTRDRRTRNQAMAYRLRLRPRGLPAIPVQPDLLAPNPSAPNPSAPNPSAPSPSAPSTPAPSPPVPSGPIDRESRPSGPVPGEPPAGLQTDSHNVPSSPPSSSPPSPIVSSPPQPDLVRYDFEYHYSRSSAPSSTDIGSSNTGSSHSSGAERDRYQGYVIAPAQTHRMGEYDPNPGVTEIGFNGHYRITAISDYDDSRQQDAGQVFVSRYSDVNTGTEKTYTPYYYSQGLPSGTEGLGSELDFIDLSHPHDAAAPHRRFGQDRYAADPALVQISDLAFTGREGDQGRFRIRLTRQPQSLVTLIFTRSEVGITVDADGQVHTGTQDTLTFTRDNWDQPQTARFVAELDGSDQDRPNDDIAYVLSGGLMGGESYAVGPIQNTDAPDPDRYGIDFDFRADHLGFWTPARRRVLQRAANDWSSQIAADLPGFRLSDVVSLKHPTRNNPSDAIALEANRYVDDLVIFTGAYDVDDGAGAWAGVQIEGAGSDSSSGSPSGNSSGNTSGNTSLKTLPRVSMLTINQRYAVDYSEADLYWLMSHEIGHALGLIRQSQAGRDLIDSSSPETAVFRGRYARAANGDRDVPLQSQDGPNPITGRYDYGHPAAAVDSILGYTQRASRPTTIDYAMLADVGYSVYGFNA